MLGGMLSFWPSIVLLSIVQGVLVALPGALRDPRLARLRSGRWAVIPPLSVVGFVFVARAAENASAQGLTYLALVCRAAAGRARAGPFGPRGPRLGALLVVPLFALAWADRGGLAGEAAALALAGLSCVSLGVLLAAVTPPRWLGGGDRRDGRGRRGAGRRPTCCSVPTTRSTPPTRRPACRGCRAPCSARR